MNRIIMSLAFVFWCSSGFAGSELAGPYGFLRQWPFGERRETGQICEKLALFHFQSSYPSDEYTILSNVYYYRVNEKEQKLNDSPSGEADFLFLKDGVLFKVIEVKCPRPKRLVKSAVFGRGQLARFEDLCVEGDSCSFELKGEPIRVDTQTNKENITYELLSYAGSGHRYDTELSLNIDDIEKLRIKLLRASRRERSRSF